MIGKAIHELVNGTFHFRNALDGCLNGIAELDSYASSPTQMKDSPIKIRQDLLATKNVVNLALNVRRLIEVTNMKKSAKGFAIATTMLLKQENKVCVESEKVVLYDFVSRIIHSRTCVVGRNVLHVSSHFGVGTPKQLLEGELATTPILIVESDKYSKSFCTVRAFIDGAYKIIEVLISKNEDVSKYLSQRTF